MELFARLKEMVIGVAKTLFMNMMDDNPRVIGHIAEFYRKRIRVFKQEVLVEFQ
jgi:hypothetical protein